MYLIKYAIYLYLSSLPLSEFCTNEAIQCTEIYEYAMSLGNASFVLANFQVCTFKICTLQRKLEIK